MTDDLVTRLRDPRYGGRLMMCAEAADLIEKLQTRVRLSKDVLVKRMRDHSLDGTGKISVDNILMDAADLIERLENELYELKLAAAGGEDAPGSANAITAYNVAKWQKDNERKICNQAHRIGLLEQALLDTVKEVRLADHNKLSKETWEVLEGITK